MYKKMSDIADKSIEELQSELTSYRNLYSRILDGMKKHELSLHILRTENKALQQYNNTQKSIIDAQRELLEKYKGYAQSNLGFDIQIS